MKKLILGLFVSMSFVCASDIVKMPSKEVLKARLEEKGLSHFADKTTIIAQLAGYKKEPFHVAMAVDLSINEYFEYVQKEMSIPMAMRLQMLIAKNKPLLFEALLEHAPVALEELKNLGFYEPE